MFYEARPVTSAHRPCWSAPLIVLSWYLAGCAGRSETPRVPVAVVVGGAPDSRATIQRALAAQPVDAVAIRSASVATTATFGGGAAEEATRLGAVRQKYLAADVDGCLQELGSDTRVDALLAARDRDNAARLSFWRVACRIAGDQRAAAEAEAAAFAALELRMPPDARDASPEVENLIDQAIQRVSNTPSVQLEVSANVDRASVWLDGRSESCLAPCVLEATAGSHVISVTADGVLPVTLRARFGAPRRKLTVTLPSAPPDVAATQWRARYESSSEEQSVESARLLSIAVPARYLVLLSPEREKLRGLLYFDRRIQGRAEVLGAAASSDKAPAKVIEELLHQGKLVESKPLLARPLFWIVAVGTAALASTVTYFVLRDPPDRTEVRVQ